jgi:nitrous oxide reductase
MKNEQPKLARRGFLAGAGIVAAAGAAAALTRPTTAPAPTSAVVASEADDAKGYHISEHIRKYYKTTLI